MGRSAKKRGKLHFVMSFLKGSLGLFLTSILFSMFNTALNTMTPQVIKVAVDSVLDHKPFALPDFVIRLLHLDELRAGHTVTWLLWLFAGAILLIALLAGICSYFSRSTLAKGSENFVKEMRDKLFAHIQRLPFRWHVGHQTGEIIQRCTSDVNVVRNFVANQLMEVFRTVFLLVISLVIMFHMDVGISLIVLTFVPVVAAYSGIFYSRIARKFRDADVAEGILSSTVQENLTGVRVVRAFGRERFEIDRFDEKNNRFADLWIKLGNLLSIYWGTGDFITGLQILIVVVVGTIATVQGNITLGEFLAFVSYVSTLVWPLRELGRILSEMSKAGVSIERIAYILDAEEEQDSPGALTPPMNGDIRFEQINFTYEGQSPVLRDIDFTIPAGSTFAILGGTGSGKSTLVHLLDRLYDLPPECGRITVGGVDIAGMKRDWVRQNIGLVLQEPFLFSKTIVDNIRVFRPQASLSEVRNAAQIACVDDAVQEFSEGYDTVVGERGVTLSGGQKQRVAIARMLMQKAPIMVFDDSLSAVDSETDSQIRRALRESLGSSTVILISHRITTLMQADKILVLDNGRIAQMGTHEELVSQEGIYRSIYDIQLSSDDRSLLDEKEEK